MCYKDIIELLSNSIQIIGIFAAIIIGLVVSKILSIKAEQDDLKIKISDGEKELKVMEKQLQKTKEENYEYYKKETIDEIMYSIFSKGEKYDYYSDKTPFVENEYKEKFCNYIIEEVIKKAYHSFKDDKVMLDDYKKTNNIKKDSIEEYAIDELYDWGDFNGN